VGIVFSLAAPRPCGHVDTPGEGNARDGPLRQCGILLEGGGRGDSGRREFAARRAASIDRDFTGYIEGVHMRKGKQVMRLDDQFTDDGYALRGLGEGSDSRT